MPGTFARFLAAAAAVGYLMMAPAQADDSSTDQAIRDVLGDPAPYRDLIRALQDAVRAQDAAGVAHLVSYPLKVTLHGKAVSIANPQQFVAHYDAIITPEIAAAIENQAYGDLFVNGQGIMFGQGEVWVNGICHDSACKRVDARVISIQPGTSEPVAPAAKAAPAAKSEPSHRAAHAAAAVAGELFSIKDWTVGCDNGRACVAIGMTADDSALSGYLRIARDGEAEAAPVVSFVIYPPDGATAPLRRPSVRLALDAHKAGSLPEKALPVAVDGNLYRVELAPEIVPDLVAALRSASRITVALLDGEKTVSTQGISLAGSTAALLKMDDLQKRVGTVTALVKPGSASAATIPPVPALPLVASRRVTDLGETLPPPPRGLPGPSSDCSEGSPAHVAFGLGDGAELWGNCASTGAYNYAYDFFVLRDGVARDWSATVPGIKVDDPSWLWNPYVDSEAGKLRSGFRGRGLGDCGDATEWAYDGEGFAALSYRAMGDCRGVLQQDWPVLYRARAG
jgi:hypothetical protein